MNVSYAGYCCGLISVGNEKRAEWTMTILEAAFNLSQKIRVVMPCHSYLAGP
jgi:hypothetical protein